MNAIGDILPLSRIVPDMEAGSKKRLFEQAAQLLEDTAALPHTDIFECLINRERLGSTGLGHGVAIPHGRHACIQDITGAFIRLREGVDFDAPDGKPVSMLFVLLVPENTTDKHLEILSHLAEKFSEKSVRDAITAAQTAEELHEILIS